MKLPPEERAAVFQEQTERGAGIRRFHARFLQWQADKAPYLAKTSRQSARRTRYRYYKNPTAEPNGHSRAIPHDQQAAHALRKAAEAGDAALQNNLGFLHYLGRGVTQDYQQAARWFRLAADQNHPDAQYNLAFLYYYGRGVAQDYLQAADWFDQAGTHYCRPNCAEPWHPHHVKAHIVAAHWLLNRSVDPLQRGKFAAAAAADKVRRGRRLTSSPVDTGETARQPAASDPNSFSATAFGRLPPPAYAGVGPRSYAPARAGARSRPPFPPRREDVSALTGCDR